MCKVYVKTTKRGGELLVAVCDAEILGKTLEGGHVPFKVNEYFYKGIMTDMEEAINAMKKATICNIVGKNIVRFAVKNRLVHKSALIYLGDVPHAQIIHM